MAGVEAGRGVKAPQAVDDDDGQQHEIPVAQQLGSEHAAEVLLVLKLLEHGGRRASLRKGEVGSVAQVDHQGQTVDGYKDSAAQTVPPRALLHVQGQHHHDDVGYVGDEDGCRVEHQSALPHVSREAAAEVAPVVE